jgi:hypothetical protein
MRRLRGVGQPFQADLLPTLIREVRLESLTYAGKRGVSRDSYTLLARRSLAPHGKRTNVEADPKPYVVLKNNPITRLSCFKVLEGFVCFRHFETLGNRGDVVSRTKFEHFG